MIGRQQQKLLQSILLMLVSSTQEAQIESSVRSVEAVYEIGLMETPLKESIGDIFPTVHSCVSQAVLAIYQLQCLLRSEFENTLQLKIS